MMRARPIGTCTRFSTGLIELLMDGVLGQPAENEQQVRINVLDAPAPERVGIPAFIDIGP